MKKCYLACLLFITLQANAQFSGGYNTSNWTISKSPVSTGSVNTAGAPASILITGSDGAQAANVDTDYTIVAANSGIWSFSWSYHTNDTDGSPQFDPAGILINGVFTQLTNNSGAVDQGGGFTAPYVTAGTVIGFRIRATDNIYGTATLSISNFSPPGGILPVNLLSFNAALKNNSVLLQWQAASEENFSHYELQHSNDGMQYTTIEAIQGSGQSMYKAVHQQPSQGLNHYRLRLVDMDGSFSYSKIALINFNSQINIKLYPNPVADKLTLELNTASGVIPVVIYDAGGRVVQQQTVQLTAGLNRIAIYVAGLPTGRYQVAAGKGNTVSFVKQ